MCNTFNHLKLHHAHVIRIEEVSEILFLRAPYLLKQRTALNRGRPLMEANTYRTTVAPEIFESAKSIEIVTSLTVSNMKFRLRSCGMSLIEAWRNSNL